MNKVKILKKMTWALIFFHIYHKLLKIKILKQVIGFEKLVNKLTYLPDESHPCIQDDQK